MYIVYADIYYMVFRNDILFNTGTRKNKRISHCLTQIYIEIQNVFSNK